VLDDLLGTLLLLVHPLQQRATLPHRGVLGPIEGFGEVATWSFVQEAHGPLAGELGLFRGALCTLYFLGVYLSGGQVVRFVYDVTLQLDSLGGHSLKVTRKELRGEILWVPEWVGGLEVERGVLPKAVVDRRFFMRQPIFLRVNLTTEG